MTDQTKAGRQGIPTRSKDDPIQDQEGRTYGDVLGDLATPNPSDEAALNELRDIARERSEGYFLTMPHDVRVAVLASALHLSLAEPAVEKAADKGKSVLYSRVNLPKKEQMRIGRSFCSKTWSDFRAQIEIEWGPTEDARSLDLLADAFVDELANIVVDWGKSEISLEPLFLLSTEGKE